MSSHIHEPTLPSRDAEESPLSFTILWSPLPPITWIIPFIGHMGIATSRGVACDFQGPYTVGERGRMVSLKIVSLNFSFIKAVSSLILLYLDAFKTRRHLARQQELCE